MRNSTDSLDQVRGSVQTFRRFRPERLRRRSVGPSYLIRSAHDVNVSFFDRIDLGSFTTLATNFTVDLAAGTQVVLFLEDADGNEAWSDDVSMLGLY